MIRVAPYWDGFGDLWAVTSHCCLWSQRAGQAVYLSRWSTKSMRNREQEVRGILNNLEEEYTRNVVVTDERVKTGLRFSVRDHHEPYVPTRTRWVQNDGRIISYQITTPTKHRPARFCDPTLIKRLGDHLPGWKFIALGKEHQRSLSEIVEILSRSVCFVGIDSGISHVAHSVGVPVFLKAHGELDLAHPNKEYVPFDDLQDLKVKLCGLTALSRALGIARPEMTKVEEKLSTGSLASRPSLSRLFHLARQYGFPGRQRLPPAGPSPPARNSP